MQGSSDSPLTPLGVQQAEALRPWLASIPFDRAYASPQPRALRTAEIVLTGRDVPIFPDDRLREARLGAFEGMTFSDAKAAYPEAMRAFTQAPDQFVPAGEHGETFAALQTRVQDFLGAIATEADEQVLVVSHALVLLTMRVCMLELPLSELREGVYVPACSRCEAVYENGRWALLSFGPPIAPGAEPGVRRPF